MDKRSSGTSEQLSLTKTAASPGFLEGAGGLVAQVVESARRKHPMTHPDDRNAARNERLRRRLRVGGYRIVARSFYLRSPGEVARGILGKYLVRIFRGKTLIGRIVEAEAYYGKDDPASHAFRGMTARNELMFDIGGKTYIYLAYGNHFLLNIVTGGNGKPGAVLIRAIEPVEGIAEMAKLRGTSEAGLSTKGPGRLSEAFAIDGKLAGYNVTDSELLICRRIGERRPALGRSSRIGISRGKELLERYYIPDNLFVSAKPNT